MTAAIVLDGWTLKVDDGEPRVRDLDLAERAGLKSPRDVRRTIKTALEDEAIGLVGGAHGPDCAAFAWVEKERVAGSVDPNHTTDVYYLNEEAALTVLTRLRTKAAIQVTRALVSVFVKVRRGEMPGPAASAEPVPNALEAYREGAALLAEAVDAELLDKREAVLRKMVLLRKETGIDLLAAPTEAPARGLPQAADLAEGQSLIITKPVDKTGHYSASELGRPHGLSAVVVGKLAEYECVKGAEGHGKWSPITDGTGRVVNRQWLYNDDGKARLEPALRREQDRRKADADAKAARQAERERKAAERAAAKLATGTALGGTSGGAS